VFVLFIWSSRHIRVCLFIRSSRHVRLCLSQEYIKSSQAYISLVHSQLVSYLSFMLLVGPRPLNYPSPADSPSLYGAGIYILFVDVLHHTSVFLSRLSHFTCFNGTDVVPASLTRPGCDHTLGKIL
jgi:hypothetical protein